MKKELTFRYAERKDTHLILQFIRELADYERMLEEVVADEATLEEWIFDKQKAFLLFWMEKKSGLHSSFTTFPPSLAAQEFIWRIFL